MPGTNLTRDEATARSALIDVTSYAVELDLTQAEADGVTTFGSTTTIAFACREPGGDTFADLVGATVHEVTLNGAALDPAEVYADNRIALPGLAADNVLVVRADCTYSHTGEGLHHFVDPADDRVYLYSQFEVPDSRRVFTAFEQPDLKAPFTFTVHAPAHWLVVSNAPAPEPVPMDSTTQQGMATWSFPETKPLASYVTAIVAGPYHAVHDAYEGPNGTIPLGHYARQSLKAELDRDREEIVTLTQQGFEFFEGAFGVPYPFEKYDQLYVPEFNAGAMENAGAITLRDEYLPRSRQPRSFYEFRASVILHEMAHMWFGDLVTMKWWDDLWLNESFAEWACYHAEAEATSYTDSWTGFTNARKQTGYRADALPSTHPIATDMVDLHAVEVNFDMITYAKGASVLKQLVAWVGLEPFLKGLGQYFTDHSYSNTTFADLLSALETASGRDLASWAQEWLQTAGTNTLAPDFEVAADPSTGSGQAAYTSFAVVQTAPEGHPTLRRHRLGIGCYDKGEDGRLTRSSYVEVDVAGERTEISELVGARQPDLLLLNDSDLAFAKIRLDERSLATAIADLSAIEDSLARALVWGAAWDMTRDAEMSATGFVELVLGNIGSETDSWGLSRIPTYAAQAVTVYSDPAHRDELRGRWEAGLKDLLTAAEPGSDHQLTFAQAYAGAARSDAAVADLEGLLDGSVVIDGLAVDQDLRWLLLANLARVGRTDDARIDTELAEDNTITGREKAAAARAAQPTAEAKARAWEQAMIDPSVPNETHRSVVLSFWRDGQEEVLAPYVERYLADVAATWERLGSHKATVALTGAFPRLIATDDTLAKVDAWLAANAETVNPGAVRYVREGRDDVARSLAAQARDTGR
ncbi:MAG: aminopeptidase N [Nocardioidaceae bacterium]|nr:aminopeptidase N [Nocardioidaceae bacterium]MCL2613346.1 aminopeptidase N [Nocardioidaceae bacterium]